MELVNVAGSCRFGLAYDPAGVALEGHKPFDDVLYSISCIGRREQELAAEPAGSTIADVGQVSREAVLLAPVAG